MKILVLAAFLLIGATSNAALAADQAQTAKTLMQVLGFDAMLESVQNDTAKMVQAQMEVIVNQFRNSNPDITEEIVKEFEAAVQRFGSRINDSWDSAEAAKIYASSLVEGLPESEMQAALKHYRTPEGQRELKVMNEAVAKTNGYIMGSIQKETEAAMHDFMKEIDAITDRALINQK